MNTYFHEQTLNGNLGSLSTCMRIAWWSMWVNDARLPIRMADYATIYIYIYLIYASIHVKIHVKKMKG